MDERESAAAANDGTTPPPLLPPPSLMGLQLIGKDVSVGEYDVVSGLTFVTRQRGRLHFHMGVNALKTATAMTASDDVDTVNTAANQRASSTAPTTADSTLTRAPSLRTGAFTGLALFPEEAFYLLQRGALVLYELDASSSSSSQPDIVAPAEAEASQQQQQHDDPATIASPLLLQPLSTVRFVELLLRRRQASLACLDAYVHLKEHQFYPRRPECVGNATATTSVVTPRHYDPQVDMTCTVAFDVWQLSTDTIYVPNTDRPAACNDNRTDTKPTVATTTIATPRTMTTTTETSATSSSTLQQYEPQSHKQQQASHLRKAAKRALTKRKVKRLRLAFRVVVCRFADAVPPTSALTPLVAAPHIDDNVDANQHAMSASDSSQVSQAPLKLAVVDTADRSVLFFEVA